jgi:hypothetical protein
MGDSLRCQRRRNTCPSAQFVQLPTTGNFAEPLFVDAVHYSLEKKETIVNLLRDHIFDYVIVANGSHGQRNLP